MNIIEQKENEFIKYLIRLNEEELKRIKQEVISNCGEITHYCYEADSLPDFQKLGTVENFHGTFLREEEYDYFYTYGTKEVYLYEYDLYSPTLLTQLIDRLLSGDVSAIDEINQQKQDVPLLERYAARREAIKQEIHQLLTDSTEVHIQKLGELKEQLNALQEQEKRNRDRKSDLPYYPKVASCIEKVEVMRIGKDGIVKVNDLLKEAIQLIEEEIGPFFSEDEKKIMSIAAFQKKIGPLVN